MKAEIINIGDELLIGNTVNTNGSWMAAELDNLGIMVKRILVIADEEDDIVRALDSIGEDVRVVLITGGLGPTHDDITKHTLAAYFTDVLVKNDEVLEDVNQLLEKFGKKMNGLNESQALVPSKCEVVRNKYGTAPGMIFNEKGKIYVSMPGVPFEMKKMMTESVNHTLRSLSVNQVKLHEHIKTFGIAEASLAEMLAEQIEKMNEGIKLAFLPSPGEVKLRLSTVGKDEELMRSLLSQEVQNFEKVLGHWKYGRGEERLENVIGNQLKSMNLTISTAESCTGGKLASRITTVPGSSKYFKGSTIAYSNEVKVEDLSVSPDLLTKHGAVSQEVVEAMAMGARKKYKTDLALSTSGIAGPDGGSNEKPVGTIWIALAHDGGCESKLLKLRFERKTNINLTASHALNLLRKYLMKKV